jgi:ubiquinone/menaquinone biosynthesis C-methylase UbiE
MAHLELDPKILAFYRDRYEEDGRLTRSPHGRLELARTQELLRRHLPGRPATIADIGGGTGVHARWLAADGYQVHLVDPVPDHVQHAGRMEGVTATLGDARALDLADASADATLLLGPLYHLVEAPERAQALREAVRVTRPGGPVFAAAISRYAGLLELAALGQLDEATEHEVVEVMVTGVHQDNLYGFTNAYFHRPDELAAEMGAAGLTDITVYGVEGPTAGALDAAGIDQTERLLPSAVRCAALLETDAAVINASPHFLAVGWRGPDRQPGPG